MSNQNFVVGCCDHALRLNSHESKAKDTTITFTLIGLEHARSPRGAGRTRPDVTLEVKRSELRQRFDDLHQVLNPLACACMSCTSARTSGTRSCPSVRPYRHSLSRSVEAWQSGRGPPAYGRSLAVSGRSSACANANCVILLVCCTALRPGWSCGMLAL